MERSAAGQLSVTVFQNEPKLPPSPGQAALKDAEPQHYGASILRLFRNYSFVLLVITYGINVGVFYGISTLLGQIVLAQFEVSTEQTKKVVSFEYVCALYVCMHVCMYVCIFICSLRDRVDKSAGL